MPRLPAKQREAEKISTQLPSGRFAATAHDAPSRHAFDAHAISLLSSLRGDKKKRKQTLESYISVLTAKREEFRKEKKTGAGSATEAIEFYEYTLDKNVSWKGVNEGSSKSSGEKKTSEAKCKVCNHGGDLICCSQQVCQNYFHTQCSRPNLDEDPPSDWNCAYCDVAYVTGLKPQARKRRIALSAVRAMDKAKADIESGKISPEEYNSELTKKRTLDELYGNEGEAGTARSQRQRRSKVIFDPQGNDSDEKSPPPTPLVNEELQVIDKDEIPIDILKKLSPKSINANSKHGQYNCKYCMDDEITETCCFCACRVCFSKHDRDRTILCDICDAEYHMDCLSPPLERIPSKDWFCPTCVNVIATLMNDPKRANNSFIPSSPANDSSKAAKKSKIVKASRDSVKTTYASKQPRLPSGRFAPKNVSSPDKPVKRGPGRPPKSATKQVIPKKTGTGRPRGRPPKKTKAKAMEAQKEKVCDSVKIVDSTLTVPKKRGRGRPPSASKIAKKEVNIKKELSHGIVTNTETSLQEVCGATHSSQKEEVSAKLTTDNANDVPNAENYETKYRCEANNVEAKSSANECENQEKAFVQNSKEPMNEIAIKNATAAARSVVVKDNMNAIAPTNNQPFTQDATTSTNQSTTSTERGGGRVPRRKPGARECMQISRRFGANIISQQYMETLLDYCTRGKVEHLIRMRERLDDHSRFLELQLAGLEMMIEEKGGVEPGRSSNNEKQNPDVETG